ncbi:MAG: 6-phosphogluconolactonase [Hydrogenovibrio sp.]
MTEINGLPSDWIVFDSPDDVADYVVEHLLQLADDAIRARGRFTLVTAGGTTPQLCYQRLAQQSADWDNWHIYMGDERCLPAEDAERNSVSLTQAWLFQGDIPEKNIHFMPTELGAELAAKAYRDTVNRIETFDVVLLGMGEDGHTASLFPGHLHPEADSVVTEHHSPKPPPDRVSLSYDRLSRSRVVLKLITGSGKREAVKQWLAGADFPIVRVQGQTTRVLIDSAAL